MWENANLRSRKLGVKKRGTVWTRFFPGYCWRERTASRTESQVSGEKSEKDLGGGPGVAERFSAGCERSVRRIERWQAGKRSAASSAVASAMASERAFIARS